MLVVHWPPEQAAAVVAAEAHGEGLQVLLLPGSRHARDHARARLLPRARAVRPGQVHQDHQEECPQGITPKL